LDSSSVDSEFLSSSETDSTSSSEKDLLANDGVSDPADYRSMETKNKELFERLCKCTLQTLQSVILFSCVLC